ncbi:uncharacterized protein V6R79_023209 [Siganus canaliculatus]
MLTGPPCVLPPRNDCLDQYRPVQTSMDQYRPCTGPGTSWIAERLHTVSCSVFGSDTRSTPSSVTKHSRCGVTLAAFTYSLVISNQNHCMDPSKYPRGDSNNAGKRKWKSEGPEKPRKKHREISSLPQGPSQQFKDLRTQVKDSTTERTSRKREREDIKERKYAKRLKLSLSGEDRSSDEGYVSGKRPGTETVSNCCSRDNCSLVTHDDSSEEDQENSNPRDLDGYKRFSSSREGTSDGSVTALTSCDRNSRTVFRSKYKQEKIIGEGAYGSVFAGYRKCDNSPVAIKHISAVDVTHTLVSQHGHEAYVPLEVALLTRLKEVPAVVELLDWYDFGSEVVLVMERPEQCANLSDYLDYWQGGLKEYLMKVILYQLVNAFIEIHSRGVLHRDVHVENVLIEYDSLVPRVRIIDFGCGSFLEPGQNKEWVTVWQIGSVLYKMTEASPPAYCDITEDCESFLDECLWEEPEFRSSLIQLLHHPWLNTRLNLTSKELLDAVVPLGNDGVVR